MQDRANHTAPEALPRTILDAWPVAAWRDTHVAIAVSGGSDSVGLLRGLAHLRSEHEGRGELFVLHYDHATRDQSAADAEWVAELGTSLGITFRVGRSSRSGLRSEDDLRAERREFLARAAADLGARYLATGHTADDQAETVLFRALRGSGVRGLAGIRPTAPLTDACTLVRPLLGTTRAEIAAYLGSIGQAWRDDTTNADPRYTRNWLRHEVLPLLEQRFPATRASLRQLAEHAAEVGGLVDGLAAELLLKAQAPAEREGELRLRIDALATEPHVIRTEAIRLAWRSAGWPEQAMTARDWRSIADAGQPATLPGGVLLRIEQQTLVLAKPSTAAAPGNSK